MRAGSRFAGRAAAGRMARPGFRAAARAGFTTAGFAGFDFDRGEAAEPAPVAGFRRRLDLRLGWVTRSLPDSGDYSLL